MRSSEGYVTNNDENLVSEQNKFNKSTCSGDSACDIFENDEEIITEYSILWFNTKIAFFRGSWLKFLSVLWHKITII